MRRTLRAATPLLALLFAVPAPAADLGKHKEWEKSPEFSYLATDDEKKAWKDVKDEAAADKFVALFWAKRDPDLKTPANEYRERFDALVAKADELFKLGTKRGALTERGKAFILIGPPKAMSQAVKSSVDQQAGASSGGFNDTGGGGTTITQVFRYEAAQLQAFPDVKSLELTFQVDNGTKAEFVASGMSDARRLEKKAVDAAMVSPNLKELPVYKTRQQIEAEQKAVAGAAAEAAKGVTLSAPVLEVLQGVLAKEGASAGALSVLPLAYKDGATRLMVQLHVPAAAVPSPEGAKIALLVRSKDGKDAARREEAAGLQKSKSDWFVDRSLPIEAGDYDVAAALLDAAGTVLATAKRPVTVAALSTDFSSSPLFVAYNDFPAAAPKPDDAFVFSVRKFVARGDGLLDKADGISYAIRLYNPTPDAATNKITLKRTIRIKPKNGPPVEVPQPAEEPAPAPDPKEGKIVLDLAGNIVESNLGEYFRPGDYTLQVKITDAVSGKVIDAAAPFTVVGPPPAPAGAPKKK